MATATLVLGMSAMFFHPVMPGPEMKKANTSLKLDPTNSLYSSEPKIYLNWILSDCTSKSNWNSTASLVFTPAMAVSKELPGVPMPELVEPLVLGPGASLIIPVDMMTPEDIGNPEPAKVNF